MAERSVVANTHVPPVAQCGEGSEAAPQGQVLRDELMSRHTSWRLGGPADRYCRPADMDDLCHLLRSLPPAEPLLWIGLGSNLLVRDGGFRGTVVDLSRGLRKIELLDPAGRLCVEAGVSCARLARFSAEQGFAGAGFLIGIPGTLGGALAMNAGAYGGETWPLVIRAALIDRQGRRQWFPHSAFRIGYRSVELPGRQELWFTGAELQLSAGDAQQLRLQQRELLRRRAQHQPLGEPSCGSVFCNPPGDYAARLIEQCGLKGARCGSACVSKRHANFILLRPPACATDVEALIERVRQTVAEQCGISLKLEVRIVGDPMVRPDTGQCA